MCKYYIDLKSSIIKIYKYDKKELIQIEEKSILFEEFFSEDSGITINNYQKLVKLIKESAEKHNLNNDNTKIYANGIWRKIPKDQYENLKSDFFDIGFNFNVISQDEENYYYEKSIQGIYNRKKVLIVDIGFKITELIKIDKGNIKEKKKLNIGISNILNKFPYINDIKEKVGQDEVIEYILDIIKEEQIEMDFDCAIYMGEELRFQELLKYKLIPNNIFFDGIHIYMIEYEDFNTKNKEIMKKTTLQELYEIIPENKKRMYDAKARILLGQAIFKKAKIKIIVPSDLNIINGVIRDEQMKEILK